MEAGMSAYERHLAEQKASTEHRFSLVRGVMDALLAQLGESRWRLIQPTDPVNDRPAYKLVLMDGRGMVQIEAYAGHHKAKGRMVFSVPTWRSVQFGPNDWDTVRVSGFADEMTFNEERDPAVIARAVRTKLLPVAHEIAEALDAEQAKMSADRDKGAAVLNSFLRAGWRANVRDSGSAVAYVPEGHALRVLGISSINIDLETGGMEYGYRTYLPGTTTVDELVNVKLG